jgi:hypothetical protein
MKRMRTTTASALSRAATEPSTAYAARGRRQKIAVLAGATLFGIWLGTSAPTVSPAAGPGTPAAQPAAVQSRPAVDPGPVKRRGPFGTGRGR